MDCAHRLRIAIVVKLRERWMRTVFESLSSSSSVSAVDGIACGLERAGWNSCLVTKSSCTLPRTGMRSQRWHDWMSRRGSVWKRSVVRLFQLELALPYSFCTRVLFPFPC